MKKYFKYGNMKLYYYWGSYAFYIYFKIEKEKYRLRFIPKFHSGSKDKRKFLLTNITKGKINGN